VRRERPPAGRRPTAAEGIPVAWEEGQLALERLRNWLQRHGAGADRQVAARHALDELSSAAAEWPVHFVFPVSFSALEPGRVLARPVGTT
jgi:hypothetical protein